MQEYLICSHVDATPQMMADFTEINFPRASFWTFGWKHSIYWLSFVETLRKIYYCKAFDP